MRNAELNSLIILSLRCGVRWTPLRSRSTDRAGRRDRRKARGTPFFPPSSLQGESPAAIRSP